MSPPPPHKRYSPHGDDNARAPRSTPRGKLGGSSGANLHAMELASTTTPTTTPTTRKQRFRDLRLAVLNTARSSSTRVLLRPLVLKRGHGRLLCCRWLPRRQRARSATVHSPRVFSKSSTLAVAFEAGAFRTFSTRLGDPVIRPFSGHCAPTIARSKTRRTDGMVTAVTGSVCIATVEIIRMQHGAIIRRGARRCRPGELLLRRSRLRCWGFLLDRSRSAPNLFGRVSLLHELRHRPESPNTGRDIC